MEEPLNILYLHSHDTGRLVEPYGHPVRTPYLMQLAREGVLFSQAFCVAPSCSPSRAALLTGQYAHNAPMLGLAHRGFYMTDFSRHLVHVLRSAGYTSALAGIQHIGRSSADIGYDHLLNDPIRHNRTHLAAAEFLDAGPRGPWFVDVGFLETHRLGNHWHNDPPRPDGVVQVPPPLPDEEPFRRDIADYNASAERLDDKIGHVLAALQRSGQAERTLVICTTDHGIAFPGFKCTLRDGGVGVMLILRGPSLPAGCEVSAVVTHLDLFPTICALAGLATPPWLAGKNLLPLIEGRVESLHEQIFAEVSYHAAYEPMRSIRTTRHKYIRRFHDYPTPVLPNIDDGESKTALLKTKLRQQIEPREELYDLHADPQETMNLIDDPTHASVRANLCDRLAGWMDQTEDPLVSADHVPAPPDAAVDAQSATSPREGRRSVRS